MIIILKIAILLNLLAITIQDFKTRTIYLWLFITLGLLFIILRLETTVLQVFLWETGVNLILIVMLVSTLALYAKYKLKTSLFKVFGLGDLAFFVSISLAFTTLPFFIYFIFSLLFSLLLFMILKKGLANKTVPLAGLQSLFFLFLFLWHWFFPIPVFLMALN